MRDLALELELDTWGELGESIYSGDDEEEDDTEGEGVDEGLGGSSHSSSSSSSSSYQVSLKLSDVSEKEGGPALGGSFSSSSLAGHLEALLRAASAGGGEAEIITGMDMELSRRRMHSVQEQLDEERRSRKVQARELSHLRGAVEVLEKERELLLRRLGDAKDVYGDLRISEALAVELRHRQPEDLSVAEHLKLQAHELVRAARGDLEQTRVDLEATREGLSQCTAAAEAQQREAQRAARLSADRERGLEVELSTTRAALADMTDLREKGEVAAQVGREASSRYDGLMCRCLEAEGEVERLKQLCRAQADTLADLAESERQAQRRAGDAEARAAMLDLDKTYAQNERGALELRLQRAERGEEAAQMRVVELEHAREKLTEDLLTARRLSAADAEALTAKELQRIRDASAKELAAIRGGATDAFEREAQALREGRLEALAQAERLRGELSVVRRDHDEMLLCRVSERAATEASIAEARSEAAMKSLELAQLSAAHEERCSQLRQRDLDVEMLRTQLDAVKVAFSRLEAESSREVSKLQHLLESERAKLETYEELELEIDSAIVRAAQEGSEQGLDDSPVQLPTGQRRRMRHALQLARRLLQRERELVIARGALSKAREEIDQSSARISSLESAIAGMSQPAAFMVEALQEREDDASTAWREAELLRQLLQQEADLRRGAEREAERLRAELRRLMSVKQDAVALRCILDELRRREVQAATPPVVQHVANLAAGAYQGQPRWYRRSQETKVAV